MKTSEEILDLVRFGETSEVEFKRARGGVTPEFWESYSAFANTDGGVIVLGVKETCGVPEVEGLQDPARVIADLWNAANNIDRVSCNVLTNRMAYSVDVDGKSVVVVEVPRADRTDRPVYVGRDVFRGTFRRNGEGDYHCNREAVNAMIRDQCMETADNCLLDELSLDVFNADSLRRYRMLFANLRTDHVWCALPDDEFLVKIGAAKRGRDHELHPNLAGLVCFGDFNVISDVLPDFFLDYREHFMPTVRWTDRICSGDATWSGNVLDFYFKVCQPATAGVRTPFKIAADNVTRDDDTPVHKSIREVLANALIHADYHGRQGIVIEKYIDRLVVSNPGTFRIGKQVAIAGGTSDARNARIFNIFSLVKIGERSGLGLAQLHGVWQSEGFERPQITEVYDPERTRVEIRYQADLQSKKANSVNRTPLCQNSTVLSGNSTVLPKNSTVRSEDGTVKDPDSTVQGVDCTKLPKSLKRLCEVMGQETLGSRELCKRLSLRSRSALMQTYIRPGIKAGIVEVLGGQTHSSKRIYRLFLTGTSPEIQKGEE